MSVAGAAVPRPLVLSDLVRTPLVREVILVVGWAGVVGASAMVSFPLPGTPVPVTLQTFAVLLGGAALGWRRAAMSLALYLAIGVAGVPWFAGQSKGWGGPTFGYVLGFVAAAALVGFLAARRLDRTPARTVLTMALGTLTIYAVGVPWLAASLDVSLATAIDKGVQPFLVGDALKILLAAAVLPATWRLVRRTGVED